MTRPTDLLAERATALAERVAGMAWSESGMPLEELLAGAKDATLLDLTTRLGDTARALDAVASRIAGELERRSAREVAEPLAKRMGEKSAATLLSTQTGLSFGRSVDWCQLGARLARRTSLTATCCPSSSRWSPRRWTRATSAWNRLAFS